MAVGVQDGCEYTLNAEALKPDNGGLHCPDVTSSPAHTQTQSHTLKTCEQATASNGLEINEGSGQKDAL